MAQPNQVLYIDTLLALVVLSFVMDYLLLWATSRVTQVSRRPWRLGLGSLIGTAYFLFYYLSALGLIPYYASLRFWPVIVLISLSMVLVSFYPLSWRQFLRITGFFYFIAVSSGGAGMAAGYALGWGMAGRLLVAIAAILIVSELGWGVVQKSIWQQLYHVPLEVHFLGGQINVTALLDTGNRLREPLGGSQVIVLEHSAVAHLLPDHLRDVMKRMGWGDLSEISRLLTSSRISARFRVIPFASLGNENGLLIGFRPDRVFVKIHGRQTELKNVVIGIAPHDLDPDRGYRALIHPDLVHGALEADGTHVKSTSRNEGESAHVSSTLG